MIDTLFARCLKPIILKNAIYPCGQCPLCRRKKMLEWILRGTHELHTQNNKAIFVTLTYKPRYLPREGYNGLEILKNNEEDMQGNLRPEDMTLFFKRLRKYISKHLDNKKIKYIYCGEYGTLRHRPHYHAIIYGLTPEDIPEETVQKIWGMGKVVVDKNIVTEYGIQYTVGYCSKKILDSVSKREYYYKRGRIPPFLRVSKGIGENWATIHRDEYMKTGYITWKKSEVPIPRYYLKVLQKSEGKIIRYKTLIAERNITNKIYYQSDTRIILNPNGKYTTRIWELQRENLLGLIKEAEENTEDQYYFETIGYYEKKLEELDKRIIHTHKVWNIVNNMTEEQLIKICNNKRFKDEIYKNEWTSTAQIWDYKGIMSDEYIKDQKEKAKHKIHILLNGKYGQRQKMEINQTLQRENI